MVDASLRAAVAAVVAVSAVTAVTPVVVSLSSVMVPLVVGLLSVVPGGASVVGVPEERGGTYDIPWTMEVGGGASRLGVGGSLDVVVVVVVVVWVAEGGTPGGGGGVGLWPRTLGGVLAVGVAGWSTLISACGGGGRLG